MSLDVLRAVSRNPDDAHLVLDHLQAVASQQRLVLTAQACLMLQHASPEASAAFIGSRFDPDWGPVTGISAGTSDPAALLRAAWQ
jgi:putative acyl-CoA dehydrogenase